MTHPRQWTCQEQSTDMVANFGSMYKSRKAMQWHSDQPCDHQNKHDIIQCDQATSTGDHYCKTWNTLGYLKDRWPAMHPANTVPWPVVTSHLPTHTMQCTRKTMFMSMQPSGQLSIMAKQPVTGPTLLNMTCNHPSTQHMWSCNQSLAHRPYMTLSLRLGTQPIHVHQIDECSSSWFLRRGDQQRDNLDPCKRKAFSC